MYHCRATKGALPQTARGVSGISGAGCHARQKLQPGGSKTIFGPASLTSGHRPGRLWMPGARWPGGGKKPTSIPALPGVSEGSPQFSSNNFPLTESTIGRAVGKSTAALGSVQGVTVSLETCSHSCSHSCAVTVCDCMLLYVTVCDCL